MEELVQAVLPRSLGILSYSGCRVVACVGSHMVIRPLFTSECCVGVVVESGGSLRLGQGCLAG